MSDTTQQRRTCDICYKIKTRCIFDPGSESCKRCARLNHQCTSDRALLKPGRPRHGSKNKKSPTPPPDTQLVVSPPKSQSFFDNSDDMDLSNDTRLLPILRNFSSEEVYLVDYILNPKQIAVMTYGPTFRARVRADMVQHLVTAPDRYKDALLSFAYGLLHVRKLAFGQPTAIAPTSRNLRAIQALSKLGPRSLENARLALSVAVALVTYNDLSVGTTTLPISQSALIYAEPWQKQLIRSTVEDTDPNIICLLFAEMYECLALVKRAPIFRYEVPLDNTIVDHYYGICHELLPHMYDIWQLYHALKWEPQSSCDIMLEVCTIGTSLDHWDPKSVIRRCDAVIVDEIERDHFLLQAEAFKLAVRILLLQIPQALGISQHQHLQQLALDLRSVIRRSVMQGSDRPKYLLFPYFVACLELEDETEDSILQTMSDISNQMAPSVCRSMSLVLKHIVYTRRRYPHLAWFQCVPSVEFKFGMGP